MSSSASIQFQRLAIPVAQQEFAHLIRVYQANSLQGRPVFMLHGLMDNASCFYDSEEQTGLAYLLAKQGYDVYLGELRGRHLSSNLLKNADFDVDTAIKQDLPALIQTMQEVALPEKQIWIGQGFGSLALASYLARYPQQLARVLTLVHFSPFRVSQPVGALKNFWVNWLHKRGVNRLAQNLGYVPALKLKLGRSNESLSFYQQALSWLDGPWEGKDGFDYTAQIADLDWPPSLYFASLHNKWRGSEHDARAFMFDFGSHNARLIKLGRKVGNQHNYKRSQLCLHPKVEQDYFPLLIDWLEELN